MLAYHCDRNGHDIAQTVALQRRTLQLACEHWQTWPRAQAEPEENRHEPTPG